MKKSSLKHWFVLGMGMMVGLFMQVVTRLLKRGVISMHHASTTIAVAVLVAIIATLVTVLTGVSNSKVTKLLSVAYIVLLNALFFAAVLPWMGIGITVIGTVPDSRSFSSFSVEDILAESVRVRGEEPAFESAGLTLTKIDNNKTWTVADMKIDWSEFESAWARRWLKCEDTSSILWKLYYSPELRVGANGELIEVASEPLPSQLTLTVPATVQTDDGMTTICQLHALMSTWVVVALVAICALDVVTVFIFISKLKPRRPASV